MAVEAVLRRAEPADSAAVADVWLRSFGAALPGVRRAHSDASVRAWIAGRLIPKSEVWVAEADDGVVAMMALDPGWIQQLYVAPEWRGRGLGDRFVALAKARNPAGLQLWTFQVNSPARRFYERHGFRAVELTDGDGNEEREPDVRYQWSPNPPG